MDQLGPARLPPKRQGDTAQWGLSQGTEQGPPQAVAPRADHAELNAAQAALGRLAPAGL